MCLLRFADCADRDYTWAMSAVEQIKAAIQRLTLEERADLARWLHGWADDEWDGQMRADLAAGRLDKLVAEADADIDAGRLKDLP